MTTLKDVNTYYCNVNTNKKLSYGPYFYTDKNTQKKIAILGTKEGEIIKIPLVFSKIKEYRKEYEIIRIKEKNIINLKDLFLDQEVSSSIIGYYNNNKKNYEIIILNNGTIYKTKTEKQKIQKKEIYNFEDSFNSTKEFFEYKGKTYFFITTKNGYVLLLNENGKEIIKFNLNTKIYSEPKYEEKKSLLLVGGKNGILYSFKINIEKKTIQKLWEFKTEKEIVTKPVIKKIIEEKEVILIGSTDKKFYCLNLEGEKIWEFKTEGKIISEAYVEDINNDEKKEIIFGSSDDKIYVLNAYGNEIWDYETDFWIATKPIVLDVDDDSYKEVFVGSYDNKLYCFSPDPEFIPNFFSGTTGIIQQTTIEEENGYFAKLLFKKEVEGMIIGMNIIEEEKILGIITHKGEFISFKFEKK